MGAERPSAGLALATNAIPGGDLGEGGFRLFTQKKYRIFSLRIHSLPYTKTASKNIIIIEEDRIPGGERPARPQNLRFSSREGLLILRKEAPMELTESPLETASEPQKVTTEKLKKELKAVMADVEELLKITANQAGEKLGAARAKAEESLKSAKTWLAKEESVLKTKANSAAKAADEYVRANPWKAVGIGALAGFVLGLLISRR